MGRTRPQRRRGRRCPRRAEAVVSCCTLRARWRRHCCMGSGTASGGPFQAAPHAKLSGSRGAAAAVRSALTCSTARRHGSPEARRTEEACTRHSRQQLP
eukprot:5317001-Prymnesium_polylepis.1